MWIFFIIFFFWICCAAFVVCSKRQRTLRVLHVVAGVVVWMQTIVPDSIRFYTFLNSYLGRFLFCTDFSFLFVFFFPFVVACFHRLKERKKSVFFSNYMFCHWLPFWLLHIHTQKYTYHVRSFLVFNIYFIILMLSISCLLFRQFRYTIFLSLLLRVALKPPEHEEDERKIAARSRIVNMWNVFHA